MDIKVLIGIMGRPWFIEPVSAKQYAEMAAELFRTGSVPAGDKRRMYSDGAGLDFGPLFRVDENGSLNKQGPVQVIRINYPIAKYDYCGDPGTQSLQQLAMAADADPNVKSIVLWIDSPGGQVDGTEALANTIKNLKKPAVTYTDGMLASAAYWIGSSAREIISLGSNNGWNEVIGSIGTMCMWMDASGYYEKKGVKIHTVFATESKDKWGDFFEMNKGNYEKLIADLDGLNNSFLKAIKSNRQGKIDVSKENVLTGKTYNTNEGIKYGLVDKKGDFLLAVKRSLMLAKQQSISKNNTMAFPKTLKAAKAESFEIVDEIGFGMTEEQVRSIESTLTASEDTIAQREETLRERELTISSLNDQVEQNNTQLQELQAEIAELKNKPAAAFAQTTKQGGDNIPGEQEKPVHSATAQANQLRIAKGLQPIK